MLRGVLIGLFIGYVVQYFNYDTTVINTIQSYVTFDVTNEIYYVICAVMGCILFRGK